MTKKNGGLGRGLDAIFLDNALERATDENSITVLNLSLIDPKSDQPRKLFRKEPLEELASSIKENGLLQPILVREYQDSGRYQIIAGERRFRASKIAGLAENRKLENIMKFDDFIKKENRREEKKLKISEVYIHSFIDEHE